MITQLNVLNEQGDLLQLPMDSASSGYEVEDITGLDPVKASLVSSAFATVDGSQFQASRRDSRNMVITLSLEPDYVVGTVDDLRQNLYKYFMTESRVTVSFERDNGPEVFINGIVESCDVPRFTKDVKATISVICFNPDFVDPEVVLVEEDTVTGTTDVTIPYSGTVETGFRFQLLVDRAHDAADGFVIVQYQAGYSPATLTFSGIDLEADDIVEISTVPGNKYATLYRDSDEINVFNKVDADSVWMNLYPGDNLFRVSALGDPMPYTVEYVRKLGGL